MEKDKCSYCAMGSGVTDVIWPCGSLKQPLIRSTTCYETEITRLKELLGEAISRLKSIDAGVSFTHHKSLIAKLTAAREPKS